MDAMCVCVCVCVCVHTLCWDPYLAMALPLLFVPTNHNTTPLAPTALLLTAGSHGSHSLLSPSYSRPPPPPLSLFGVLYSYVAVVLLAAAIGASQM